MGSNVNSLVPFYALGVFTAFTMAGFGMAKYHHTRRERNWRYKFVINFSAGVTSLLVVLIFVVVKFSEGAWLVVVLFIVGVPLLIRLNRQYRMEATVLEGIGSRGKPPDPPSYSRRTVYVFIDDFDLATIAGLRYARSLRPTNAARGALRHRQRPGRQAAPGLAPGQPRHPAGLRRLPGPQAGRPPPRTWSARTRCCPASG